jgi:hypothetical protein
MEPDYAIHKPKVKYSKPSKKTLSRLLKRELGKRYVWAEEGPDSFDCSGLTYYCYGTMNMTIPRVAREQIRVGQKVSCKNLQFGDLVFFDTSPKFRGKVTHVGVYIGNGKFEHASSQKSGVKISSLNSRYYQRRLLGCRRYLNDSGVYRRGKDGRFLPAKNSKKIAHKSIPKKSPKPSIQKVSKDLENKSIYIQVASFANAPSQDYLLSLKESGYSYRVSKTPAGNYRVLIGGYRSRKEALEALERVRAEINPMAFIFMSPTT